MSLLPAPRIASFPCRQKGCDGSYEPYSDGSVSCYQGHPSGLSVDDVEISGLVLVSMRDEC